MKGWMDRYANGEELLTPIPVNNMQNDKHRFTSIPNRIFSDIKLLDVPSDKELLARQAWQESAWKPLAKSNANALGPLQIRKVLYKDYIKATGDKTPYSKVTDFNHAIKVRNWQMNNLMNSEFIKDRPNTELNKKLKAYAAYNQGKSGLIDSLNKAKEDGIDIYTTTDWLKYLPKETQEYVDRIVFKKVPKFEEEFSKAMQSHPNRKYFPIKENGGQIQNLTNFTNWLQKYE